MALAPGVWDRYELRSADGPGTRTELYPLGMRGLYTNPHRCGTGQEPGSASVIEDKQGSHDDLELSATSVARRFAHAKTARKEMTTMKRYIVVLMVLMSLSLPLVVSAEETVIPPEANWSPTPPARPIVDLVQLVQLLVAKGVITDQEYAQLTRPQSSSPSQPGHARLWRWDEIYRNPVLSRP
jgi:hypothetical protein